MAVNLVLGDNKRDNIELRLENSFNDGIAVIMYRDGEPVERSNIAEFMVDEDSGKIYMELSHGPDKEFVDVTKKGYIKTKKE